MVLQYNTSYTPDQVIPSPVSISMKWVQVCEPFTHVLYFSSPPHTSLPPFISPPSLPSSPLSPSLPPFLPLPTFLSLPSLSLSPSSLPPSSPMHLHQHSRGVRPCPLSPSAPPPLLNQLLHMVSKTRAVLLPCQHAITVQVEVPHHWNVLMHGLVVVFTYLHRYTHVHHTYSKYECTHAHTYKCTCTNILKYTCMYVRTHTHTRTLARIHCLSS